MTSANDFGNQLPMYVWMFHYTVIRRLYFSGIGLSVCKQD